MTDNLKLAVVGAGLVGKCHISSIIETSGTNLACIVDPSEASQDIAKARGVEHYFSIEEMFNATVIDGVVLATPNHLHMKGAMICIKNACPVLVEKPLCVDVKEAETLVAAAKSANVPLLTGHHRRHGAAIEKAKQIIVKGTLGTIVAVQGTCWFHKPVAYFDTDWRKQPGGGGPVFINLIHDVNTLLYLIGDVESVHALGANMVRNGSIEDTAAILIRFQSGVLATMIVSDTISAPWSWEMTSGENPAFQKTSQTSYLIGGTHASLSLPNLSLWRHTGSPNWLNPIDCEQLSIETRDPLIAQIKQFAAVIRGEQPPLVSGVDGLQTLRIIEAIKHSITTGDTVDIV